VNTQVTRSPSPRSCCLRRSSSATTYWQTWAVAGLADRQDNALARVAQLTVDRGEIYTENGRVVLATNVSARSRADVLLPASTPNGYFAPHVRRLLAQSRTRAGLERSQTTTSRCQRRPLRALRSTKLDKLTGVHHQGDTTSTSRSTCAHQENRSAATSREVRCRRRDPAPDRQDPRARVVARLQPNAVENEHSRRSRAIPHPACPFAAPLLDRATQGVYPAGSTVQRS
jgi:hypothetical protein